MALFSLREKLPGRTRTNVEIAGAVVFLLAWWAIVEAGFIRHSILPSPVSVVTAIPEMHVRDHLWGNMGYSLMINIAGYLEAVLISVPLGFLVGLFGPFRALAERLIAAMRYLPLTAVSGLFILWFGISHNMKIQFLTLGIVVYLLPVVVQRIDDVEQVYLDTARTLGASRWQRVRTVFVPSVMARLSDDIRVLVAISWTYIIIAEGVNIDEGGLGAMVYRASRISRTDKVFALVLMILAIGFIQDKIALWIDRHLFRFKHV